MTWTHELIILATETENTPANRQAYGGIYANNGSGESSTDEGKALQNAMKLQESAAPGVIFARCLKTPMNAAIRPLLKTFCLNTLSGNRMFIEVDRSNKALLRLYMIKGAATTDIQDFTGTFWEGKPYSKTNLLAYLLAEFGVERYVPPES